MSFSGIRIDQLTGKAEPLCNRFDLIGGTSMGAILAAGLAMGKSTTELRDFYLQFGHDIFKKTFLPVRFWHKYPSGPLEKQLQEVLGETTDAGQQKLQTQIMLVAKNATLGNDFLYQQSKQIFQENSRLPSVAGGAGQQRGPDFLPAPDNFQVPDDAGRGSRPMNFIDGGVSSYNNPALQVFLEATIPEYGAWAGRWAQPAAVHFAWVRALMRSRYQPEKRRIIR